MMRWVMLASVLGVSSGACGDDGGSGHLADAPPGSPDARMVDAGAGAEQPPAPPVIVTVTLGGVPQRGQTVYFQDAATAVAVEQLTGPDGSATAMVIAGGYVTVIEPEPVVLLGNTSHLSTFVDVQPGDHLYVDVPDPNGTGAGVTFTVSVPNEQLGYDYTLFSTCGARFIGRGNSPLTGRASVLVDPVVNTVTLNGCGGRADLLAVGADTNVAGAHSWQYTPDDTLTEAGTVTFTGYDATTNLTFSYPNTLASSQGVNVTRQLRTGRGILYTSDPGNAFVGDGTPTAGISMPDPAGALAITTSIDQPTAGNSHGQQGVIEWGANTDYSLDFTAVALHDYATLPALNFARHAIVWTEAAEGAVPDFKLGQVTAQRTINRSLHTWTWRIVGAYDDGGASLQFPTLPTTIYDFNITVDDSPTLDHLRTVKSPNGYRAARPRLFAGDLATAVAGATGQIVFEDMFDPPPPPGFSVLRTISRTLRRGGFTRHAR